MDNKDEKEMNKKKKEKPRFTGGGAHLFVYMMVWLFFIFLLKVMGAM